MCAHTHTHIHSLISRRRKGTGTPRRVFPVSEFHRRDDDIGGKERAALISKRGRIHRVCYSHTRFTRVAYILECVISLCVRIYYLSLCCFTCLFGFRNFKFALIYILDFFLSRTDGKTVLPSYGTCLLRIYTQHVYVRASIIGGLVLNMLSLTQHILFAEKSPTSARKPAITRRLAGNATVKQKSSTPSIKGMRILYCV